MVNPDLLCTWTQVETIEPQQIWNPSSEPPDCMEYLTERDLPIKPFRGTTATHSAVLTLGKHK